MEGDGSHGATRRAAVAALHGVEVKHLIIKSTVRGNLGQTASSDEEGAEVYKVFEKNN